MNALPNASILRLTKLTAMRRLSVLQPIICEDSNKITANIFLHCLRAMTGISQRTGFSNTSY